MAIDWPLASNWGAVKLGIVAPEESNQIKPSDRPAEIFNYWGLDAIEKNQFVEPPPNLVLGSEVLSTCIQFGTEHVLYSKLRPYLNKVIVPSVAGIGSTEWIMLKPDPGLLDRHYLAYVLRTQLFVNYATANSTGARMPRARKDALRDADVPVPHPVDPDRSLETQRRIVARIEALFAELGVARELHQEVVEDTEQLMSAVQREVFAEVDIRFQKVRLEPLTSKIGSGSTPRGGRAVYTPIGIPFIRSLNVRWNEFSFTDLAHIDEATHGRMASTEVQPGDVLLNITGASIGRACCVPEHICPANVNQHVSIIRPRSGLSSQFLMYWLTSPQTQEFINYTQVGATRQALTKGQIEDFRVPQPSDIVQDSLVEYLDSVRQQIAEMCRSEDEDARLLNDIEQAVLTQAFRGEL
jgi:type I restriction enzyme S subunit